MALLVEKLIHHARAISPWGYEAPAPGAPAARGVTFEFVLNQVTRAIEPRLPLARMIGRLANDLENGRFWKRRLSSLWGWTARTPPYAYQNARTPNAYR